MKQVRVRIAPSPTGLAHIGTIYTALFNFAFARHNKGKFILRIEDTDIKRHVPEAEKVIYEALGWLGLKPDEGPDIGGKYGPYRQSERLKIYQKYAQQLIDQKLAYKKEGAIWFKVNSGKTGWVDLIRGKIEFDNDQIKDFVILKSDSYPSYNFAVTVDDWLMEISPVVRAEDHISNTPRQIMIYKALGVEVPDFAHLPLLRNQDHSKISKRKNPVAVSWHQEQGYLPESLVNFLSLLGWSHPEGKEFFPVEDFVKNFSFKRVSTSAPVFDLKKLDWLNGFYIRQKTDQQLFGLIKPFAQKVPDDLIKQTIPLVKERLVKLSDYYQLIDFFVEEPKVDLKLLLAKGGKDKLAISDYLSNSLKKVKEIKSWKTLVLEDEFRKLSQTNDYHLGKFFMSVRIALTGKSGTPPLFETMEVLGQKKVMERLESVIKKMS